MLPISFTASIGFREFMDVLEPNYKIPCVKTVKNRIQFVYEQVSKKIALELSAASFVAWTSDCWSSRRQNSYISVTAHFLDAAWSPKNYTLATEELPERHTAVNLTAKLQSVLDHWKLDGKLVTVVTDNAANAKNSVKNLNGLHINEGLTCAAHSLQLCITKALKNDAAAFVCERATKVVSYFHRSNIATTALELKQEQLGISKLKLIQSCCTRWDSTYHMIERLLVNRGAVINVLSDRSLTNPTTAERLEITEREWSTMEKLKTILKPFQVSTTVFCGDTHSPISIVRPIVYMLRNSHLSESDSDDQEIASMKDILREELTSRFDLTYDSNIGINARQIASFLDPRYKDLLLESPEARNDVRSFVRNHFVSDPVETSDNESHQTAMDFLFQTAPNCNTKEMQFQMYSTESEVRCNTDPFEWWAAREKRYPDIAKLARKYLCIPATSASSERVFSTAGNIVSSKRNCLLPENVNLLVFLYQNRELLKSVHNEVEGNK